MCFDIKEDFFPLWLTASWARPQKLSLWVVMSLHDPFPLILGWASDVLQPIKCNESNYLPLPCLSLKRTWKCLFLCSEGSWLLSKKSD